MTRQTHVGNDREGALRELARRRQRATNSRYVENIDKQAARIRRDIDYFNQIRDGR